MAADWQRATVIELQTAGVLLVEDGNHGEYRPRPHEFAERGVAFIRAADINSGRVLFDQASRLNETARKRITKGIGARGDILLSHKGTVGKVALVPDDAPDFVCSPQTTFWRVLNERVLDRRYLYAFLRSPGFHRQLASRAGETDMAPYVSLTSQRALTVSYPSLAEQRAIATALSCLDDKIELNRRINETLEEMAQAQFKRWFVDHRPSSEELMRSNGWKRRPLGEGLTIIKGKSYKSEELGESTTALVTLKSFRRGGGYREDGLKSYSGPYKPEQIVLPGELVVAFTDVTQAAELVGRPALVQPTPQFDTLVASLDVGIVRTYSSTLPREYLYYLFLGEPFREHTYAHTNGSTVLHLASDAIAKFIADWPPIELVERFVEISKPLLERQTTNLLENRTLAELRDLLLPKLLSGELRIRDVERAVEAVA